MTSDREPYKRKGDGMDLPEGKTCGDCMHMRRCMLIYGRIKADESCDWYPVRFEMKEGE